MKAKVKTYRPTSVKMETLLAVRIGGCTHKISMKEAQNLRNQLGKYLAERNKGKDGNRVRAIQRCVIDHFGLRQSTFASDMRDEKHAWPRQIAMSLAHESVPDLPLAEIGNEFLRASHTISHAVRIVKDRVSTSVKDRMEVAAIRAKVRTLCQQQSNNSTPAAARCCA